LSRAILDALQAEAESCRQSSSGNGEYNGVFWVAAIVLENLARRLSSSSEVKPISPSEASAGNAGLDEPSNLPSSRPEGLCEEGGEA
jgi:hypothetical protein